MKKILFIIFLISVFPLTVYATDTKEEIISSMENELSDFSNSIPDYIKEIIPEEIFSGDFSSLINGEIGYKTFFDLALDSILAGIPSVLNSTSLILISVIISSLFNTMSNDLEASMLKESYNLCSSLC